MPTLILATLAVLHPTYLLDLAFRPLDTQGRPSTTIFIEDDELGWRLRPSEYAFPEIADEPYLGDDGIGCILTGAYARDDDEAGMLGYVQSGTPQQWADRIRSELETNPSRYNMPEGGRFSSDELVDGRYHTYHSDHGRPSVGKRVSIFHTLLQFN